MAVRNISHVQDFADMPYAMAKPILQKVTNPYQLYKIELNSPQFLDADEELWRAFIKRDVPNCDMDSIVPPTDGKSWYLVYFPLVEAEKQKRSQQEADLKKSLIAHSKPIQEVTFVDKVLPTPPDSVKRSRRWNPKAYTSLSAQLKEDRQRFPTRATATTGKAVIAALRRETAARSKKLAPPSLQKRAMNTEQSNRQIKQNGKQLRHAPADMIKHAAEPCASTREIKIIAPRQLKYACPKEDGKIMDANVRQSLAEHEARLMAIKANTPVRRPVTPPPEPPIVIPDELPVNATCEESSDTTGDYKTVTVTTNTINPTSYPLPTRVIQKRKAPANLFVPAKKRMT